MVNPIRSSVNFISAVVSNIQKKMFHSRVVSYGNTNNSSYPSAEKIKELKKNLKDAGSESDKRLSKDYHKYVSDALPEFEFDNPAKENTQNINPAKSDLSDAKNPGPDDKEKK